jgi:O-antigen ligase
LLALHGFQERVTDASPAYNRIAAWGSALMMIVANPLTGMGLTRYAFGMHRGDYAFEVGDISGAWIRQLAVPHNEFLNVGVMTGLVGLVLYLRIFSAVMRSLRSEAANPAADLRSRTTSCYVGAIWVGWCVNAFFADFVNMGYVNVLLYFSAGFAEALADAGRADRSPGAHSVPRLAR